MLTREYILSLQAGREMDALVEQHVFGKEVRWLQDDITDPYPVSGQDGYGYVVECYSSDISAAWEVVEKVECDVVVQRSAISGEYYATAYPKVSGWCRSAPEAICKAALLTTIQGVDNV